MKEVRATARPLADSRSGEKLALNAVLETEIISCDNVDYCFDDCDDVHDVCCLWYQNSVESIRFVSRKKRVFDIQVNN
jgi:hypothetical protein